MYVKFVESISMSRDPIHSRIIYENVGIQNMNMNQEILRSYVP